MSQLKRSSTSTDHRPPTPYLRLRATPPPHPHVPISSPYFPPTRQGHQHPKPPTAQPLPPPTHPLNFLKLPYTPPTRISLPQLNSPNPNPYPARIIPRYRTSHHITHLSDLPDCSSRKTFLSGFLSRDGGFADETASASVGNFFGGFGVYASLGKRHEVQERKGKGERERAKKKGELLLQKKCVVEENLIVPDSCHWGQRRAREWRRRSRNSSGEERGYGGSKEFLTRTSTFLLRGRLEWALMMRLMVERG